MESVQAVVVGAGVVGLACARELARLGLETIVLERNAAFGEETSARNSEVIHAGIYYPQGSLKARLCVEGKVLLYRFCAEYGVAHQRCGKLIVATSPDQEAALDVIARKAVANDVLDMRRLDAAQAMAMEPALSCTAALFSPSTGIVDSHGFMLALLGDAEQHGTALALKSPLLSAQAGDEGIVLQVGGDAPTELRTGILINSAGLSAQAVAARIGGLAPTCVPPARYAKGNYFACVGKGPFSRLIYPVPEPGGLGVHLTLDLGGQARFGPDVEWVDGVSYAVDPSRGENFYAEVRKYWPDLPAGSLSPAFAGIRPKLGGPESPAQDFMIQGPAEHGVRGLVNLFGIESPGLTSSLAIAQEVVRRLEKG